jgi:endonuclease/exonuclease/phosphatase family metal-dependent hydrolase
MKSHAVARRLKPARVWPRSSPTIRVMSFNIRYRQADDHGNRWDRRKALVIARIRAFDPDLLGIQECTDDAQAAYLKRHLKGWEFYGVRTEDAGWPLEMAPILFKRDAFELVDKGCFWLSSRPAVPGSKSWGGAFARTAAWAELRHRATGRSLVFLNTHVDYEAKAVEKSAALLRRWVDKIARLHPIVVTVDFNAGKGTSAYRQLARSGTLFDTYRAVHAAAASEGTYHDYGRSSRCASIDWILATAPLVSVAAQVDRYRKGNLFPSDHYPLTAVLRWKDDTSRTRLETRP